MFPKRIRSIDKLVVTLTKFGSNDVKTEIKVKPQGAIHGVIMDDWYVNITATLDSGKNIIFKRYFTRLHSGFNDYQKIYKQTNAKATEYLNNIVEKINQQYQKN
ncbi:hypothetical protein JXM83_02170 [Candidatus Woesearchaeota archaeon]|nr:hypothetical protein [Candidatus Woesearchaeota archaeon]